MKDILLPASKVPIFQIRLLELFFNINPSGNVSFTITSNASILPLFQTVMFQDTKEPLRTHDSLATLLIIRSVGLT